MRILVDLDDTLVDMMTKGVYYFNSLYGRDLRLQDIKDWELNEIEKWRDIWKIPGFFADLPWMDDYAKTVLRNWKTLGHEVVIVTAAPTWDSCKDKYQWVHTHLKIPGLIKSMDQFVIARNKKLVVGDIIVDDKPANVMHPFARGILFSRPWNIPLLKVDYADNWADVEQLVRYSDVYPATSYKYGGCY